MRFGLKAEFLTCLMNTVLTFTWASLHRNILPAEVNEHLTLAFQHGKLKSCLSLAMAFVVI